MSTFTKIFGTLAALVLIIISPALDGITLFPGLAMLAFVWGFKL